MKKVISIIASVLLHIYSFAVTVETTTNLNVYYPEYTKIDLVCGQMPKAAQKDVEFLITGSLNVLSSVFTTFDFVKGTLVQEKKEGILLFSPHLFVPLQGFRVNG